MFVNNLSASEIGTSQASINRTGKANAAKGFKSHYNEYKDFQKCKVEGHILAAFTGTQECLILKVCVMEN